MVDVSYGAAIWLKVGLVSSKEEAPLSRFCVYEAGSRIRKHSPNFEAALPRRGRAGDANRVTIRFPANHQRFTSSLMMAKAFSAERAWRYGRSVVNAS